MSKPNVLTFGSLFAGIGGFDLGFERAGMRCEWQVEIDPYCQRVLAKHWPNARRWDDVRTFPPAGEWGVDVICGGFPCQDISSAGKHAGLDGERSGLWFEYQRIIRILRPRYVVVENVADLLVRGFDRVLGGLAACGYDAEWQCLPAGAFGAVYSRDRVFVLACDANGNDDSPLGASEGQRKEAAADGSLQGQDTKRLPWRSSDRPGWRGYWSDEPAVGRVANGIPSRMDRLHGVGNAVVPKSPNGSATE